MVLFTPSSPPEASVVCNVTMTKGTLKKKKKDELKQTQQNICNWIARVTLKVPDVISTTATILQHGILVYS